MSFGTKVFSKINRVAAEQIGQSFLSGLIARGIKGNYILMYHGITADGNTLFNKRHISYQCLEKQIQFIKKHFSVISLQDFFEEKFDNTRPNFAITFDDGYVNNFIYAKPILEKYKCPASFFITALNEAGDNILWGDMLNIASVFTDENLSIDGEKFEKKNSIYYSVETGKSIYDLVRFERTGYDYKVKIKEALRQHLNFENNPALREYWQLMSDKHIIETSKSEYIKIGCHGYYHNNLGSIPHEQAVMELANGKKYLEGLIQKKVDQLAFPDGSYTLELSEAAYNMGFSLQLAADKFLFDKDDHELHIKKRHGIYAVDSCLNQLFTALKE
ncbi:MAG: polysaccharide deacetylase family protein [Bacteroidota bacterium]|nr:polysaccharide deacetylase family protein [Bacteroidota bacterium]